MFEILGNIYDSSIAIVFGTVFVGTLWRSWTLFDKKFFKVLYFGVFSSIKQQTGSKNFRDSGLVGLRKLTDYLLSDVFNLLNDLILAWSA